MKRCGLCRGVRRSAIRGAKRLPGGFRGWRDFSLVRQLPGGRRTQLRGIASSRSVVPEAHDRPNPALGYLHNYRPVPGARGRAPSPRRVPVTQFPYVGAHGQSVGFRHRLSLRTTPLSSALSALTDSLNPYLGLANSAEAKIFQRFAPFDLPFSEEAIISPNAERRTPNAERRTPNAERFSERGQSRGDGFQATYIDNDRFGSSTQVCRDQIHRPTEGNSTAFV